MVNMVEPHISPQELAEKIESTIKPIAETCEKLANNFIGTPEGREQAAHNGKVARECVSECENILRNSFNHAKESSYRTGPGGSSSSTGSNN